MTPETIVRTASRGDLLELARIYNHYVTNSYATFDTEPVTVESRTAWFEGFLRSVRTDYWLPRQEIESEIHVPIR